MAIIGTVPSLLGAKYQQPYKGSLICVCTEKLKTFPSKISPRVTLNIAGHLKVSNEWYKNNQTKTK